MDFGDFLKLVCSVLPLRRTWIAAACLLVRAVIDLLLLSFGCAYLSEVRSNKLSFLGTIVVTASHDDVVG